MSFSVTKRNYQRSESCSVVSNSSGPHGLYSQGNSRDQNTGVVSRSLLQGIFPTQGSNPGLPHCRQILYQLSHQGSLSSKKISSNSCVTGFQSQQGSCSATYEIPTQKQVVHEWFTCMYLLNFIFSYIYIYIYIFFSLCFIAGR